jgi:6-phospho-beta-glucosidase
LPDTGAAEGGIVLALMGGGGSRVPVFYDGLRDRADRLGPVTLRLYDIDAAALARTTKVLQGMDADGTSMVPVTATTDLSEALDGADFVVTAIRVGGFAARRLDEAIPLAYGVLGQETVGPGGFSLAARNVPVLRHFADAMRTHCPDAWMINLSNPAGLVTQALVGLLGTRVVGVCDSPLALTRQVAAMREGRDPRAVHAEYGGLNHLGWLSAAWVDGEDVLPRVLAHPWATAIEEVGLFGVEEVRRLGAIPNEYVYFYEHTATAVANITGAESRGAFLAEQQRSAVAAVEAATTPRGALDAYLQSLTVRQETYLAVEADTGRVAVGDVLESAGGYQQVALSVVEAVARDRGDVLIVNTPNRGALPFLADDDVVEVPAVVRAAGVFPLASRVPAPKRGLVTQVKAFEHATLDALDRRSFAAAADALALHPVVPSADVAARILRDYCEHIPAVGAALDGVPAC